jgi:hypothetical protein
LEFQVTNLKAKCVGWILSPPISRLKSLHHGSGINEHYETIGELKNAIAGDPVYSEPMALKEGTTWYQ